MARPYERTLTQPPQPLALSPAPFRPSTLPRVKKSPPQPLPPQPPPPNTTVHTKKKDPGKGWTPISTLEPGEARRLRAPDQPDTIGARFGETLPERLHPRGHSLPTEQTIAR